MLRFVGLPGTNDPYVRINILDEKTFNLLVEANSWSIEGNKIVDVNAIDNGKHGPKTLHGRSLAWDLDVDGDFEEDLISLTAYLKLRLPPPYEVIKESTHVHVEWDTHR